MVQSHPSLLRGAGSLPGTRSKNVRVPVKLTGGWDSGDGGGDSGGNPWQVRGVAWIYRV
jgi:hypothetical protein